MANVRPECRMCKNKKHFVNVKIGKKRYASIPCPACQTAKIAELRRVANKVVLCFPDKIPADQEEVPFNIPAYIIEELKQVVL